MRFILSGLTRYLFIPLMLFAAVIQVTVMPDFQVGDGRADLVLTLVICWTLVNDGPGGMRGVMWAVAGGLAEDLLTGVPLGVSALALATVSFGISQLSRRYGRSFVLLTPIVTAFGTLGYHLLLIGLYVITRQSIAIGYSLLHATLPGMIFNGLLSIPIVLILNRVHRAMVPKRVSAFES